MYIQHFGLTEKPFNVTPDPRFLYLSPGHQEALASMIYGIRERRGFISIIGEIGTGKTTLLHTLFSELGNDVKTVFIFNTKINFLQLLHNILMELELPPSSTGNKVLLLNQLNDYLIERLSVNENVALIIDEAQNLSTDVLEELRMLSNLETPREKLLQIVLVGQPELDFKLRSPGLRQLKQRIGINCYLTPLNQEEQMKYIAHRLSIAGRDNNSIFSPGALKLICRHSKGIPRIINIFCDNALLTAFGRKVQRIDIDIVKEVIDDFEQSKMLPQEATVHPDGNDGQKKRSFAKVIYNTILVLFIMLLALFFGFNYRNISATFSGLATSAVAELKALLTLDSRSSDDTQPAVDLQQFPGLSPAETNDAPVTNATEQLQENPPAAIADIKPGVETTPDEPSTAAPPPAAEPAMQNNFIPGAAPQKMVTAKKGDMVSSLALKEYGTLNDTIFDIIKRTNPGLEDLNLIYIGQPITLPHIVYDNLLVAEDNGTCSLHVATFSSYKEAEQFIHTVLNNNYSPSITPVAIAGRQPWHRVTVGRFANRSEAIEFAKNFKSYDLPSSVLKE